MKIFVFFVEDGWTPLHDPSFFFIFLGCGLSFSSLFWHAMWAYGIPSLGMHLLFLLLHFFFIAHILDSHFREKESWYVMEFYFVGGWQCLLCEWTCTWSWSWEYDKSLTRVKEFDKTQSKIKLQTRVLSWKSNFGLGRNFHKFEETSYWWFF